MVTGWWCGREVNRHTFNNAFACHVDDDTLSGVCDPTGFGVKVACSVPIVSYGIDRNEMDGGIQNKKYMVECDAFARFCAEFYGANANGIDTQAGKPIDWAQGSWGKGREVITVW